ncbi:carbohydrate kinase family protein [Mycolicibacterium psychrotolerans]|uniref:Fructokinase n=1 Tax=Mycolicibacterium psychrotolerans TaxID=216929 RepID=A0A7I7M8Q9_9MYCO|nr:carbohydrate kinase [Mycolicibacterium psychrotolerans]BBX67883.1 fructokinase [Mycolicibacterium psychrotolerans]
MSRALVIGEALIDVVERAGKPASEHVGGSPLNVAVGLSRLGRGVDFLTSIGDDPRGRRIGDYVAAAGVHLLEGSVAARRTPVARALLDAHGAATYTFDLDWRLDGVVDVAPPTVVHTGSIATVLEPGCLAVAALVESLRESATIAFDPNVRASLVTDVAVTTERIERLVSLSDVVKASDEDLRWLAPDSTPEEVAQRWVQRGPAVVAVTTGGEGAFAVSAAGSVRVPARPVRVADTVGAGDSFMAGMLDELWSLDLLGARRREDLRGITADQLRAVLDAAVLNSALTVEQAGALLPDRATRDAARKSR